MLARRLRGSSCVLMHLALGGNLMGDLGVSLLLSALEACGSCDTLEHLDLSNNSLAMSAGATHPNPSHPTPPHPIPERRYLPKPLTQLSHNPNVIYKNSDLT